jgi:MSHA biogenesis protein MshG
MPSYSYKGRNAEGKVEAGIFEGVSADDIANKLMAKKIIPTDIRAKVVSAASNKKGASRKGITLNLGMGRVKLEELSIFSQNMATMLDAGVPIVTAVKQLAETSSSHKLAKALADVADHLQSGQTMTSALRKHPRVFSGMYCNIIDVGENTGQLETAFDQLSTYLINEANTHKRIKSAMRYPKIVITALIAATAVINIFVVPKFSAFFSTMGKKLPFATQLLISSSDFFINYWYWIVIILGLGIFAMRLVLATPAGKEKWDRYKLKMPVFGKLLMHILITQFSWSFSLMLKSGMPILRGLQLVEESTQNAYFKSHVRQIRLDIQSGKTLPQALAISGIFSTLVLQMIMVGEESGKTADMFAKIAQSYEKDTDYQIQKFSDMLEPTLLIFMGLMVLVLALGIFMPMYSMIGK